MVARMLDPKPIRTDEEHAAAVREIDRLWGAAPGTAEADRLEVWAVLVDDYERKRWPVPRVEPVDAIRAHMEATGLTQEDLGRLLGSPAEAQDILARRVPLTLDAIRRINQEWGLPADWLIQPYALLGLVTELRRA